MICSQHEAQILVFNSVPDVDSSVFAGVSLMPGSKSFPDVVSDNGRLLRLRLLERPASSGQVSRNLVQEGSVENGIVGLQLLLFAFILDVSKMTILFEVEAICTVKTNESFVPLNFMLVIKFH